MWLIGQTDFNLLLWDRLAKPQAALRGNKDIVNQPPIR